MKVKPVIDYKYGCRCFNVSIATVKRARERLGLREKLDPKPALVIIETYKLQFARKEYRL
jgi:hypothetical protein